MSMVDTAQYLILMAACLLVTLPLELVFAARVYRVPKRMTTVVLTVAVLFSVWDIVAIQFDLWRYSPRFTTGVTLPFDLPIEELVFFIVIPICALLTYETVGLVIDEFRRRWRKRRRHA